MHNYEPSLIAISAFFISQIKVLHVHKHAELSNGCTNVNIISVKTYMATPIVTT